MDGFVYDKTVWQQAGITDWPKTSAEFLTDLKAIKSKTSATPYYTDYKDGWPLTAWTQVQGAVTCDPKAGDEPADDPGPWKAGSDLNVGDTLLYNIVHDKLYEQDPTTTNWENSKNLLATGKIGTMWLGSWVIVQMQDAARKAGQDPGEIGYMPSDSLGTISTSLFRFEGPFGAHWEDISAGAILVMVPTLVVFLFLQRFIYNGFTRGRRSSGSGRRPAGAAVRAGGAHSSCRDGRSPAVHFSSMFPNFHTAIATAQVAKNSPTMTYPTTLRSRPPAQSQNAPCRPALSLSRPRSSTVPMSRATATDRPVMVRL